MTMEEIPLTFTVAKAQPHGDEKIPDRVLRITGTIPEVDKSLQLRGKDYIDASRRIFDGQAALIEEALSHLPGGTQHALLIRLLKRQENVLRVLEE